MAVGSTGCDHLTAANTSMLIIRRVVAVRDDDETTSLEVVVKMAAFYGLMLSILGIAMIVLEFNSALFHLVRQRLSAHSFCSLKKSSTEMPKCTSDTRKIFVEVRAFTKEIKTLTTLNMNRLMATDRYHYKLCAVVEQLDALCTELEKQTLSFVFGLMDELDTKIDGFIIRKLSTKNARKFTLTI